MKVQLDHEDFVKAIIDYIHKEPSLSDVIINTDDIIAIIDKENSIDSLIVGII
jgi:L-lysine 2,3-aminomutase